MNELKKRMIRKAVQQYKKIYPCGQKRSFAECFSLLGNNLVFWFNTEDQSTHLITRTFGGQEQMHRS